MVLDKQMQIGELEAEIKMKENELEEKDGYMAAANEALEEFNDIKHEIKAKCKHLMQLYEEVDVESYYKEDDEVDINECFETMEKVIMKS